MKIKVKNIGAFIACIAIIWGLSLIISGQIERRREKVFTDKYLKGKEKYDNGLLQAFTNEEIVDAHIQYHLVSFCNYILKNKTKKALSHIEQAIVWCDMDSVNNSRFKDNCIRTKKYIEKGELENVRKLAKEYSDQWHEYERQVEYAEKMQSTREWQYAFSLTEKYAMVARGGDKMEMKLYAGLCANAFLEANDENEYRYWKHLEDSISRRLGLPIYR